MEPSTRLFRARWPISVICSSRECAHWGPPPIKALEAPGGGSLQRRVPEPKSLPSRGPWLSVGAWTPWASVGPEVLFSSLEVCRGR